MNINISNLQENLCRAFCANIQLSYKNDKLIRIETPFYFPDGDPYQLYVTEEEFGLLRLSDAGHTLMQLSYENDVDKFRKGTRAKIFNNILNELNLSEYDGEIFLKTDSTNLANDIFKFGQGLTKIYDLTFLNKEKVESTFYEDLDNQIHSISSSIKIQKDYIIPNLENGKYYPIDYFIEGKDAPLYLFGIPNKDKARLTTIIIEYLLREKIEFDSLLVFEDLKNIPSNDLVRLTNSGGEMIISLDAKDDLARKINRRAA